MKACPFDSGQAFLHIATHNQLLNERIFKDRFLSS